ncbi:MAG: transposase [Candidatus Omnitrophica bacterium]|nr:transposase [Candidatus Omnitrophota bacterium]
MDKFAALLLQIKYKIGSIHYNPILSRTVIMSTIKRYCVKNAAYFLTTNTKGRIEIFREPKNCDLLLITIEYFKRVLDCKVYGFCVMPDHCHLAIHPFGRYTFSYIMKMIKGSFARRLNKSRDTQGTIWQRKFYEVCILTNFDLINRLEYMHNNPVKAGLVKTPEQYPYSSYNHYIKNDYAQNPIISIDVPEL